MEIRQDTEAEERIAIGRLEELMLPHVAYVGLGAARAAVIKTALKPLDEEHIKGWSTCFAALALIDGATIGQAIREARRVRAALRRPDPPTAAEIDEGTRGLLLTETRALVADWLGVLEGAAAANGGRIHLEALDVAMMPPLPPPVAAAFAADRSKHLLGVGGARKALILQRMHLEDPELCLPHDAIAVLKARGIAIVP